MKCPKCQTDNPKDKKFCREREGKTLDIDHAYYYRCDKNGKMVEGRTIPVDLYAFDEFWS